MDFTVTKYVDLLGVLTNKAYGFHPLSEFLKTRPEQGIILRHDVDTTPENSLAFARLQHQQNIRGVYYFRAVPASWHERIIREIADLGHEIGYHYESLTTTNGNLEEAIRDFDRNLTALRRLVPVSTICMHGSPLSRFDSRDLWKQYDYRDFGIIGEPYFDLDFSRMAYLTDTGRRWNGEEVSVRDKVKSAYQSSFCSTDQLINAIRSDELPAQLMFTFHPQRWNADLLAWSWELVFQTAKNIVKKHFFVAQNQY